MEIKPGKFVVLTYDLYAGAGEPEETLMMRATDEMPDQFVFGVDQNILPSMLKRLEGLKQGDKFDFVLSCEEAFGERNEEHVMVKLVRDATEEELHPRHSCGCGCGHDHGSCGDGCGDCCDGCH